MKVGDIVKLKGTDFEFKITGFKTINKQLMVESEQYGDFNADLIET